MVFVLVTLLNLFLKQCYYPQRCSKLVETSFERGKGPTIGKLRYITLIEGNLQIEMRMSLNSDHKELIEKDEWISKANFGSRKNFSITTALLQKKLIFDNSLITIKRNIYAKTDLQSCYERQLPKVGSIVDESVRCN